MWEVKGWNSLKNKKIVHRNRFVDKFGKASYINQQWINYTNKLCPERKGSRFEGKKKFYSVYWTFCEARIMWGTGQHQHLQEKRPEIRRSGKRTVARRTFKDAFDSILMHNKVMYELRLWKGNNDKFVGSWPIWKLFAFSLLVIALPFPTENRKISCLFKSTPIWL